MRDNSHAPTACLNSRAFRVLMKLWIDSAADTGADIIFWDEPHFHYVFELLLGDQTGQNWACACDCCRDLFKEKYNRDLPKGLDEEVIQFRDDTIYSLLSELTEHAAGKGLRNAVCVLPDENPLFGISSWEVLAKLPSVSIFGTDPYWMLHNRNLEEYVAQKSKRVMEICTRHAKEAQVWVQAFLVPAGREEEVGRAVEIIAQQGVRNIAAWAYLGSAFLNHKCEDHQKVWDVLGEAYDKIKRPKKE